MNLLLAEDRLAICRLTPADQLPAWITGTTDFYSITRTPDEVSIVCPEHIVPKGVSQENGWRMFKVDGPLDFALTGILVSLADPLARAGISIFALSTYDTDHFLVRDNKITEAVQALEAAGHVVKTG